MIPPPPMSLSRCCCRWTGGRGRHWRQPPCGPRTWPSHRGDPATGHSMMAHTTWFTSWQRGGSSVWGIRIMKHNVIIISITAGILPGTNHRGSLAKTSAYVISPAPYLLSLSTYAPCPLFPTASHERTVPCHRCQLCSAILAPHLEEGDSSESLSLALSAEVAC